MTGVQHAGTINAMICHVPVTGIAMQPVDCKFNTLLDALTERAAALRFNQKNPQQLYAVCLLGRIFESLRACITLQRAGDHAAIPGTLRSQLEAYVDLLNLIADPNYMHIIHATYLKESMRVIRSAIASGGSNPYLDDLANLEGVETLQGTLADQQKRLSEQGYKPITKHDAFERAGCKVLYDSVYADLCLHSHNNLRVLEAQHIVESGDGSRIHFFKPFDPDLLHVYLDAACGTAVAALEHTVPILTVAHGTSDAVEQALAALRANY